MKNIIENIRTQIEQIFTSIQDTKNNIIIGLKNLWKWIPIVWKDRDWDHSYIYDVLIFKIGKQSEYIRKKDRHLDSKRYSEIMNTVCVLLERTKSEYYQMEYMDYQESEFYFIPIEGEEDLQELKLKVLNERYSEYFKKYPRQYKRVINGQINRFGKKEKTDEIIAMEIAYENGDRCKRILFKIMQDNIDKWWD